MSYNEYIDMFFEVQKHNNVPYRAFTFDVVNSRNQKEYLTTKNEKDFNLVSYLYSLLENEEELTGKPILLKDKFNRKYTKSEIISNNNFYNPIILGDMMTFFVYNDSISTARMLELFVYGLKAININYAFHFNTGVYETNNYIEGGKKLYKGYIPQILERLSKENDFVITKDFTFPQEQIM